MGDLEYNLTNTSQLSGGFGNIKEGLRINSATPVRMRLSNSMYSGLENFPWLVGMEIL